MPIGVDEIFVNNVYCHILFFRNFAVCICIDKILNFEIVKILFNSAFLHFSRQVCFQN